MPSISWTADKQGGTMRTRSLPPSSLPSLPSSFLPPSPPSPSPHLLCGWLQLLPLLQELFGKVVSILALPEVGLDVVVNLVHGIHLQQEADERGSWKQWHNYVIIQWAPSIQPILGGDKSKCHDFKGVASFQGRVCTKGWPHFSGVDLYYTTDSLKSSHQSESLIRGVDSLEWDGFNMAPTSQSP